MGYTTKEIMELMERASQLGVSVEIADQDFQVKIDGKREPALVAAPTAAPAPANIQATVVNTAVEQPAPQPTGTVVKAPIVGTYYSSPAPDKPPFVSVGQAVKKGDVLFIIESMKLMNEVQSDCDGVVREIIANNGQAVEYGQPILILE